MDFPNRITVYSVIIFWVGALVATFLPLENRPDHALIIGVIGMTLAFAGEWFFKRL